MFRTRIRTAAASVAVAAVGALLAGCSVFTPATETTSGVAFVVGARENSPAVDPARLLEYVPSEVDAFRPGSIVSVTGVDGSEDGVPGHGFKLADLGSKVDNGDLLLGERAQVASGLAELRPDDAEANVLGAIASAARSISGVTGSRTIVIADSMLSTVQPLAFQNGLLGASAEDVVAAIPDGLLPPLDGAKVVVLDQGTTWEPQKPLSQLDRTALRGIWEAVLLAAGASAVEYDDRSTPLAPGRYDVRVTPVEPTAIMGPVVQKCRAVIPESSIRFAGDLATFVSPATAREYIAQLADGLRGCTGTITISGTTASARQDAEFNHRLSLDRASAVRAELAPLLGLAVDDIHVEGLGTDFPGFVDDRPGGIFDPVLGARNRTVIVSYTA
ncbi:MAG TPA: OmpA family protein [Pseudolysinimonas sp.]|nr:OmpA family protein [Pseudolysinimonas sp.]